MFRNTDENRIRFILIALALLMTVACGRDMSTAPQPKCDAAEVARIYGIDAYKHIFVDTQFVNPAHIPIAIATVYDCSGTLVK